MGCPLESLLYTERTDKINKMSAECSTPKRITALEKALEVACGYCSQISCDGCIAKAELDKEG